MIRRAKSPPILFLNHVAFKCLCVGKSGCGKSQWANRFIHASQYDRKFIFDHDGQFAFRNGLTPAFTPDELLSQLKAGGFVVFNPTEMFSDLERAFEWFAYYVYTMSERMTGTKLIYCDEVQDIMGTHSLGEYASRVLLSGRNRALDFLGCSLQYNMVHNKIRGQITMTVAFFTDEPLAIDALVKRGFKEPDIRSLKAGQFIALDTRNGREFRGKVF